MHNAEKLDTGTVSREKNKSLTLCGVNQTQRGISETFLT